MYDLVITTFYKSPKDYEIFDIIYLKVLMSLRIDLYLFEYKFLNKMSVLLVVHLHKLGFQFMYVTYKINSLACCGI